MTQPTRHGAAEGVGCVVLSDQVHLPLRFAVRPQITIHLVPAHANIASCPPFTHLVFTDHRPLVSIETMNTTAFLEHPHAITNCRKTITTLTQQALSAATTRQRLLNLGTKVSGKLRQTHDRPAIRVAASLDPDTPY